MQKKKQLKAFQKRQAMPVQLRQDWMTAIGLTLPPPMVLSQDEKKVVLGYDLPKPESYPANYNAPNLYRISYWIKGKTLIPMNTDENVKLRPLDGNLVNYILNQPNSENDIDCNETLDDPVFNPDPYQSPKRKAARKLDFDNEILSELMKGMKEMKETIEEMKGKKVKKEENEENIQISEFDPR